MSSGLFIFGLFVFLFHAIALSFVTLNWFTMEMKEKWNIPIANILTNLQYLNTITMQNLLQAKLICTIIHPIWSTRPGTYVVTQVLRLPTYNTVQIQ